MSTFRTVSAFVSRVQQKTRDFGPAILAIKTAELLTDIKHRHGRYPSDVAWPHLKPATIARKGKDTPLEQFLSMRNAVQMGDITPTTGEVFTDAEFALIHEMGANGERTKIPARPIWAPAIKKIEKTLTPDLLRELAAKLASI